MCPTPVFKLFSEEERILLLICVEKEGNFAEIFLISVKKRAKNPQIWSQSDLFLIFHQ